MSKTPPNLADLPPDVQAFVAAQPEELARKNAALLGLSLRYTAAQKRLKTEMASAEAAETEGDGEDETSSEADAPKPPRKRKPFPKGLKRVKKTLTPSETCEDCGGSFKELGADVVEELEYVPGHYKVIQIERPRLASTCCERVVQAKPPHPQELCRPCADGAYPVLQIRLSPAALSSVPDV